MQRQKSFIDSKPTLYLVATPIGNLDDMTFRAVETLKDVSVIYCEDTRVSGKLLQHFSIAKPLKTYHDHNKEMMAEILIKDLQEGKDVALISDAGYPLISDPGYYVIQDVIQQGYHVVNIPGANALLSALVVSGIVPHPFYYYGFLDHKESKRIKQIESFKDRKETIVLYESPHRILKTIANLYDCLGERQLVIARELTKKFEEIIRGTTKSLLDLEPIKGEIVIVLEGLKESYIESDLSILEEIDLYMSDGMSSKEAIKKVAKNRGLQKNEVYQEFHSKK
jgi:16S rRNA (cytidine1402-2'-O)-methyltransferase